MKAVLLNWLARLSDCPGRMPAARKELAVALLSVAIVWPNSAAGQPWAARVGESKIRNDRVEWLARQALETLGHDPRQVQPEIYGRIREEVLTHEIDRLLVISRLAQMGFVAGENEIRWETDLLRERLDRQGKTVADYLESNFLEEGEFQTEMAWRVLWKKYCAEYLTDARLEAFFQKRRRDFDGTELKVSQVLLDRGSDLQTLRSAELLAAEILAELRSGQVSWDDAVAAHSIAPSRNERGEVGWIGRREPMPNEFSEAAFQLHPGEFSPAVTSAFGVHIIRCDEVKPGKFMLGDVREQVREAAALERFEELANEQRPQTEIEIFARN